MIVVTDSTPLRYLIEIGEIDILRELYAEVLAPVAVLTELSHDRTPVGVRSFLRAARHGCNSDGFSNHPMVSRGTWAAVNAKRSHSLKNCRPTSC